MNVVLLSADLAVVSRVEGAAAQVGASIRSAPNESTAIDRVAVEPVQLIILDLSVPELNIESAVANLKAAAATTPRIVAFGPHVHVDRLDAARAAGCDEVVSRGQFFNQLVAILAKS